MSGCANGCSSGIAWSKDAEATAVIIFVVSCSKMPSGRSEATCRAESNVLFFKMVAG